VVKSKDENDPSGFDVGRISGGAGAHFVSHRGGGLIYADLYGSGNRGVVLAHGGRFNKESWEKQARVLAAAGFCVVAIDFRGIGPSKGPGQADLFSAPLQLDVLAAVHYLQKAWREDG
jgi:pimeloyl-ACP methyl ester carboxylesterase